MAWGRWSETASTHASSITIDLDPVKITAPEEARKVREGVDAMTIGRTAPM
jgi:hypothetical protein